MGTSMKTICKNKIIENQAFAEFKYSTTQYMVEQKCEFQTLIHTMLHCIGRISVPLSHFTYVAM